MYLSTQTDLSVEGEDGCQQGIGGYHDNIQIGGTVIPYTVVLQCESDSLTEATQSMSHEFVEASTDPEPDTVQGWIGFDQAHLAWDVYQGFQDELADACEFYYGPEGAFYTQTFNVVDYAADAGILRADAGADGGDAGWSFLDASPLMIDAGTTTYDVQRTWSNKAAMAGHHPCVPPVAGPYYAVTPLDMENITLSVVLPTGQVVPNAQTQGYNIKKGQTKTFAVGFHSDGPTSGPWTITTSENSPATGGGNNYLTTSIDVPTGVNGDISYITVTVNEVDTSMNGELLVIQSSLPGSGRNPVPVLISNE
jgi:hypothetical protein